MNCHHFKFIDFFFFFFTEGKARYDEIWKQEKRVMLGVVQRNITKLGNNMVDITKGSII